MALTKKQKYIFDYIRDYHNRHGFAPTQKEIQNTFALKSLGSVQRYIKYLVNAGLITIENRSHRGIQLATKSQPPATTSSSSRDTTRLPLLGLVAAGSPIETIENYNQEIEIPSELINYSSAAHFILEVQGDSMVELGILPGDRVICRQQSSANSGEIVIAMWEGEATVKSFFRHEDQSIELRPANSAYSSFWPTSESLTILGLVVGLTRKY